MEITEALNNCDFDRLFKKLSAYAHSRLRAMNIKKFEGCEAADFVGNIFLKALENVRKWDSSKCSLEEFFFGALRSEISAFLKKQKVITDCALPENPAIRDDFSMEEEKETIIHFLKSKNADDIEIKIFQLWLEGTFKRAEIIHELNLSTFEYDNAHKRLERKLYEVQKHIKLKKYEYHK